MPNFETPVNYLRQNFDRDDRLAVVIIDRHVTPPHADQKLATAEKIASPAYQAHLRAENAHGKDIYISMNTVSGNATGRTKADIDQIRHIYLDVDHGGRAALDRILSAPNVPDPHHVLESSPDKYQVIWSVEGFDKREAETLLRGLAREHGADVAVTDCARVLRLPGFRNYKYDAPHYVQDIHKSTSEKNVYGPSDFPKYEQDRAMPATIRERVPGSPAHSQSENDWAYACRRLEQGASPNEVLRQIESYRTDKPNPAYYADRTVKRAMQYISQSRTSAAGASAGTSSPRETSTVDR